MPTASHQSHDRAVVAATLAAATLVAQQVAGKATRDTLFLSTFHVSSLPIVMIASALASVLAVAYFSAALARRTPARVMPAAVGTGTVLLLLEWGLSLTWPAVAALAVYLHMAVFGSTVVSGFWSLVNERFDPHAAKRAMARMGLGASVGGVAGGLLAWGAAGLVPVTTMLAVMAGLNVASLLALSRLGAPDFVTPAREQTEESGPLAGLRLTREVPYLRHLALFVLLGAATESLLDYVLSAQATAAYASGPALMSFFALFHTGVGVVALVVQAVLARPALQRLGLAGTVALRPGTVALGALAGLADPRLLTAILARASYGVVHNSLFRSGYELLFTPVPERHKRPAKAIVDVGFDKLGTVAGSLVTLLLLAALGGRAPRALFALAAGACLAAVLVSRRLHRGYVAALEDSLLSGAVRLEIGDVRDSTTLLTLARTGTLGDRESILRQVAALHGTVEPPAPAAADPVAQVIADLRSGRADAIRRALRRPEAGDPAVVGSLLPLVGRNDVFLEVLRVLRRAAPRTTGQVLDALLDPDQPAAVRRRLPRVLRGCPTQRAVDGLVEALGDRLFDVRRQSAMTLARLLERDPALAVPREAVFAAAVRELQNPAAWTEEAEILPADDATPAVTQTPAERGLAHVFTLLSLGLEREPVQIAYWALVGQDASMRGTALEYLENVLPEDVRRALWSHLRPARAARGVARPRQQVVDELLRSGESLARSGDLAKRLPLRR